MIKGDKMIITWCIQDVVEQAKGREIELTDEQAMEILGLMDRYHDCTVGMNWDVIDVWTDEFLSEQTS